MTATPEDVHFEAMNRLVALRGARVADIGCGTGWLIRRLRQSEAMPTGIECTAAQIEIARNRDTENAGDYVEGVGQALPLEDQTYDAVTFWYSLHHVPTDQMAKALGEAHRILKPGGVLYVLEPTPEGPSYELDRLIDDELAVRTAAQAALDGVSGFRCIARETYDTVYVYETAAEFISEMTRVDAARTAIAERKASAIQNTFDQLGRTVPGGGRSFTQPNSVRVLEKV